MDIAALVFVALWKDKKKYLCHLSGNTNAWNAMIHMTSIQIIPSEQVGKLVDNIFTATIAVRVSEG